MTREKLIAAARLARARKGYERSLAQDRAREHARTMMYGALDWCEQRDTEWATAYAAVMEQVQAAELRKRRAGDPLNLTGHTTLSKGERKVKRRASRKASGRETERYQDSDGVWRTAEVRGFSMRGLDVQQQAAAAGFERDWEATLRGLRCRGFEPIVPSSTKSDGPALARVEAQDRLRRIENRLEVGDWQLLVAVVIHRAGPAAITAAGGPQHVVVTDNIKRVLNIVADFYARSGRRRNALMQACASIIKEMERQVG